FLPLVMNNQMVVDVETIVGDVTQVILGQVLLVTFVLGCFVGFLVGFAPASVYYWKIRHIERKLKRTQSQND
ncbi:MAG: LapA family protein, partial [Gammaproteobacteria bacterium]